MRESMQNKRQRIILQVIKLLRYGKEECRKYEQSAKGLLMTKFWPLVLKQRTEFEIFGAGNDDSMISIVKLQSQADADVILQIYLLDRPYMLKDDRKKDLDEIASRLKRAAEEKDCIFIGHGCDGDDFWFSGTRNEHINCLNKICEPDPVEEKPAEGK